MNFSIKAQRNDEKVEFVLKKGKEHDFTLFQSNGLALKQGEE